MESPFTFSPNSSDCDSDTELLQPFGFLSDSKLLGQEKSNKSSSASTSSSKHEDGVQAINNGRPIAQRVCHQEGSTLLLSSKIPDVKSSPLAGNLIGGLSGKHATPNINSNNIFRTMSCTSTQTRESSYSAVKATVQPKYSSVNQTPQVTCTKGSSINTSLQNNGHSLVNPGTTVQDSSFRCSQMPTGVLYKNFTPRSDIQKTISKSKDTLSTEVASFPQRKVGSPLPQQKVGCPLSQLKVGCPLSQQTGECPVSKPKGECPATPRIIANTKEPTQKNGSSCISFPKTDLANIYYQLDPKTFHIVQHEINVLSSSSKETLPRNHEIGVEHGKPGSSWSNNSISSNTPLMHFQLSSPSALYISSKGSSLERPCVGKTFCNPDAYHSFSKRRKRLSLGSIDKEALLPLVGCQVENLSQLNGGQQRPGDEAGGLELNITSSLSEVVNLDSDYSSEDEKGEDDLFSPVVAMNELDHLFEKMSEFCKNTPMEASSAVKTKLLLHQKLALNWMVQRENTTELPPFWCQISPQLYYNETSLQKSHDRPNCINGGILADDMGLGKTLVLIALILTNHSDGKPMFRTEKETAPSHSPENDPLLQKAKEKSGTLKVRRRKEGFCQSSSKKAGTIKTPGAEFRKIYLDQLSKSKRRKRLMKSKTSDDGKDTQAGSTILLSDSDEDFPDVSNRVSDLIQSSVLSSNEGATRTLRFGEKVAGDQTLIVCPVSVLSNWTEQFECHVTSGVDLNVYVFYGQERVRNMDFLKRQDVIITTYLTLANDFKQGDSVLHKINWLRLILDEGHCIRNPHAQQTKAAREIRASRRWIVTGTPIQNRLTDLWSVIKFLRLDPFTVRSWWRAHVISRIRKNTQDMAHFDRVQKILRHISIRRMKTDEIDGEPIVRLPSKTISICEIELGGDERMAYEAMQNEGKFTICKYFRKGAKYLLKRYAHVLAIIMRLRQMCCHPALCRKAIQEAQEARDILDDLKKQERMQAEGDKENPVASQDNEDDVTDEEDRERLVQQLIQILNTGDSEDCSICLETLKEPVITRCAHVFCNECIREVLASVGLQSLCPLCRGEISTKELLRVPQKQKEVEEESLEGTKDQEWHSSAKVDSLIASLEGIRVDHPEIKCVVVSQFTSFLSLIEKPLCDRNFNFVRFDGTLTQRDRVRAIEDFNSDRFDSPTIMLLSLTAGGVGLNLSRASRVFLMDPAWNPAVEEQCFDRCHRLGQTREVIITKFIVKDSIEERMLTLQAAKKDLVNNAFGVANQSDEERRNERLKAILTLMDL